MAEIPPFDHRLMNSGQLFLPHVYVTTRLSTPDDDAFRPQGASARRYHLGRAGLTEWCGEGWLLSHLGQRFVALYFWTWRSWSMSSLRHCPKSSATLPRRWCWCLLVTIVRRAD